MSYFLLLEAFSLASFILKYSSTSSIRVSSFFSVALDEYTYILILSLCFTYIFSSFII